MDINQITANQIALLNAKEYKEFINKVNTAKQLRTQILKASFNLGSKVQFEYKGQYKTGIITKLMPKNIKVQVGLQEWSVSPSLLRIIN